MKKQLFILLFSIAAAVSAASAADIQQAVDSFVSSSALKHASVGVGVWNIGSNEMIGGYAVDQSQLTASTMKTVTSATALLILGKDYKFHTRVYTTGETDHRGRLNGNVVVRGGGDPTLGSRHFKRDTAFVEALCQALASRGIKQIKGNIIMDNSLLSYPAISPYWMVEDLAWDYGTGIHAINFADNDFIAKIDVSGEIPTLISTSPELGYMQFGNKARIITPNDSLTSTGLLALADVDKNYYTLYGNVKQRQKPISLDCANTTPALLLYDSIAASLDRIDIKIRNKDIEEEEAGELVLDYASPTLGEIAKSLLSRSDNMFAEGLLRALAVNAGKEGSFEEGVSVVRKFWKAQGIDISGLFMHDGSGLARNDKASPRFFNEMLAKAESISPIDAKFSSFLPRAGVSGTVKRLMSRTEYTGKFAVKSGSYNDVQCFVGYYPEDMPRYTVSVLVSNFTGARSNLTALIENLFSSIAAGVTP